MPTKSDEAREQLYAKSDEARDKLFAAIEQIVPDELQANVLKGFALFYAWHARMEGFDKASEIAGVYTPLAVQMKEGQA